MENVVRVSKHLVPIERIALIESFDHSAGEPLNSSREFKSRIVLRDRASILSEQTPEDLSTANGFRWIEADRVGTNPTLSFRIETFTPSENFQPSKDFRSRLAWTDEAGNSQSKLMLSEPEALLALVVRGDPADVEASPAQPARRPQRKRKQRLAARDPA